MVIAVQMPYSELSTLSCHNNVPLIDFRDASRAVLASLLTTIWGIVPTYERWSLLHNKVVRNYLFGLARTPFGTLSNSMQLSFVQKDAATKHVIFSQLQSILSEINSLFEHFSVIHSFLKSFVID